MMNKPVIGVVMVKDDKRYNCYRITDGLWWCGYCNKGKIRVEKLRSWEKLSSHCEYCGAKLASIKSF